eukprot:scaffold8631_cov28-Tisochrysis_lutea.AAC.4
MTQPDVMRVEKNTRKHAGEPQREGHGVAGVARIATSLPRSYFAHPVGIERCCCLAGLHQKLWRDLEQERGGDKKVSRHHHPLEWTRQSCRMKHPDCLFIHVPVINKGDGAVGISVNATVERHERHEGVPKKKGQQLNSV